jgi:hypothetical protein
VQPAGVENKIVTIEEDRNPDCSGAANHLRHGAVVSRAADDESIRLNDEAVVCG